jgi:hypothetical protein
VAPASDRRHDASVFLYGFDLIELDGEDMRRDPLSVRKATLASLLAHAASGLRLNEHIEADVRLTRVVSRAGRRTPPAYPSPAPPSVTRHDPPALTVTRNATATVACYPDADGECSAEIMWFWNSSGGRACCGGETRYSPSGVHGCVRTRASKKEITPLRGKAPRALRGRPIMQPLNAFQ